jgi:hypothetical protein
MTQIETAPAIASKQNPKDLLVIIAIMAAIFGLFAVLFI